MPSLAVSWRRMHDAGRSGWWSLSMWLGFLVAGLGAAAESEALAALGLVLGAALTVTFIVFALSRTQPGANRFGPEPPAG